MPEKLLSLSETKQSVSDKITLTKNLQTQLSNAIDNCKNIDDIKKLLDYKITFSNLNNFYTIYKLKYKALGITFKNIAKAKGRKTIFSKNPDDIISRFRHKGIITLRTASVDAVNNKNLNTTSKELDNITNNWRGKMVTWLSNEKPKLSSDEAKINDIKFKFSNKNYKHSSFSQKILDSLNGNSSVQKENKKFKFIRYTNGEIYSLINDIIVLDLSEQ